MNARLLSRSALAVFALSLLACSSIPEKAKRALGMGSGTTQTREGFEKVVDDGSTKAPKGRDAVDCDDPIPTKVAKGCAIETIGCDTVIEANNRDQTNAFDDDFVVGKYCAPQRNKYGDGPDARWMLDLPENTQADIVLTSDCVDLDLFSVRWAKADTCPTPAIATGECEGSTRTGQDKIRITSVSRAEQHLVWVDGKEGATGNFRLEVKCKAYR